ncbi:MAG: SDR family NAD(P)-dependent oxidoreductase [Planctomycetes bacterium]|nr:SDR family NAD(P)-dependent oxidoreductase [Planctomycetota bacterium]
MSIHLVTGGAGFIGSHMVEALVGRGHSVVVVDNFSSGSMENLQKVEKRIHLFRGDVTDRPLMREAMKGVHCVYHLAGPLLERDGDPMEIHHSGATGTLSVLMAARQAHVRRAICASSCMVYGTGRQEPRREDEALQPLTPYAVAKWTAEQQCLSVFAMDGLETVRLRYFHVYGPRQNPKSLYTSKLARILEGMLAGRRPVLQANRLEHQDLIFVDDVVHANILAAVAPRVAGRVFNIASGKPTSLLDVVSTINRIMGARLAPLGVFSEAVDEHAQFADIAKAEVELGFCPGTDLEQGLRWCIEYHRRQPQLLPMEAASN